jgi:Family of unknown function (DUF6496)
MPRSSPRQRKTLGRVMHEFKHGELKSGAGGGAGKVRSRRQAIAIALHEAGASKYASKSENRRSRARTARKEARGETYQQEREGASHVGARGRRESSAAMGGSNARKFTAHGRKAIVPRLLRWIVAPMRMLGRKHPRADPIGVGTDPDLRQIDLRRGVAFEGIADAECVRHDCLLCLIFR